MAVSFGVRNPYILVVVVMEGTQRDARPLGKPLTYLTSLIRSRAHLRAPTAPRHAAGQSCVVVLHAVFHSARHRALRTRVLHVLQQRLNNMNRTSPVSTAAALRLLLGRKLLLLACRVGRGREDRSGGMLAWQRWDETCESIHKFCGLSV